MTRSFDTHGRNVVTAPNGARVHKDHLAQSAVIARKFYEVRPGAWCLVGNGLSNQTFIDAPDGVIAIDTGESVEEMALALRELRKVCDRQIAAVVYSHFHYVEGTRAIFDEGHCASPLPIYGHPRVAANKARTSGEIAPAYGRGVVEQFAVAMPTEGADGIVNVGLGFHFRNPEHAPFTPGYVPVTHELGDGETRTIAGLEVVTKHSPSDSDDSVNLLFPSIDVCVHNTVWPTLFNVFAIRGEEFRDPRVLISGIENIIAWAPMHLIATHGPPLTGRANIAEKCERYRDSIQFLWDQTVRGINKGWTMDEIATRIRLPDLYDQDYLTSERYGVAEHHVRQIFTGLRGWFDGDESKLFPLEPEDRFTRLIAGFGGRSEVAKQAKAALEADDIRWGVELATWLVRSRAATAADRELLARALRLVAERTPAANIRNWAITRARHLDRSTPMDRFYGHGFSPKGMAHASVTGLVHTLRVLLDPAKAAGVNAHAAFAVDGEAAGLHVRNCVAVPTDGTAASGTASMSRATLLSLFSGKTRWPDAEIEISGDASAVDAVRRCFEHAAISG